MPWFLYFCFSFAAVFFKHFDALQAPSSVISGQSQHLARFSAISIQLANRHPHAPSHCCAKAYIVRFCCRHFVWFERCGRTFVCTFCFFFLHKKMKREKTSIVLISDIFICTVHASFFLCLVTIVVRIHTHIHVHTQIHIFCASINLWNVCVCDIC